MSPTRSWWGWGWVEEALSDDACRRAGSLVPGAAADPTPVPAIADLAIAPPRISPPASLATRSSQDAADRAGHARGKAYRDVVRNLTGDLGHAPDLVLWPSTPAEVVEVLDWAGGEGVAVVPYGGGSSVVGGVEYRGDGPWASVDLTGMDRVTEVDRTSRAARIQGGALGPVLEDQLRPLGLTLRHFPQSFEFSTIGGWIATRSGGHYATGPTHIDDLVESMTVVTPAGTAASFRLPGSGAGPSSDRLFLGSEGILGIVTEAWVRLADRPGAKASASVGFAELDDGLAAVRAIVQSGLWPANCRLLDAGEAAFSGTGDGTGCVLVLGFEAPERPVDDALATALELARDHGGTPSEPRSTHPGDGSGEDRAGGADRSGERGDAVASWRSSFMRMPYQRDALARMGVVVETFETATTWDRVPALIAAVRSEVGAAIEEVCGAPGLINCRLTHVYPDGAAPYFTVIAPGAGDAPGRDRNLLDQVATWDQIKAVASEVLARHRATITHHHAVGRDHRPTYDTQRPEPFAAALRAAKGALDPEGICNPGVLIDP